MPGFRTSSRERRLLARRSSRRSSPRDSLRPARPTSGVATKASEPPTSSTTVTSRPVPGPGHGREESGNRRAQDEEHLEADRLVGERRLEHPAAGQFLGPDRTRGRRDRGLRDPEEERGCHQHGNRGVPLHRPEVGGRHQREQDEHRSSARRTPKVSISLPWATVPQATPISTLPATSPEPAKVPVIRCT